VAYSSNPTAPGGYYRSMLGRALLKTREMVQNIDAPDRITNRVAFAAFGALDGQVTLQGAYISLHIAHRSPLHHKPLNSYFKADFTLIKSQ
jgi:hypothetical protein